MKTLSLELPVMYGDHHVKEVRRILLEIEGVKDIYASSSFQIVEVKYDDKKTTPEDLTAALEKAGYTGDLSILVESSIPAHLREGDKHYRTTSISKETRNVIGFEQEVVYQGRTQWPCPGLGLLNVVEPQTKETNNG
ncbi:MAG: heavy-metal-associated domain-containing protein [Anaerolineales bacterium]|nr:heavy-metal-associated domain-containing protein [Anaerolineales bacterium]